MELKELQPMILMLVLIALIVGIGVLVMDKFGAAVKDSTILLDETVTITSNAGQLANDDVTSVEGIHNDTIIMTTWIGTGINWTTAGVISTNFTAMALSFNYTYDKDSSATTALASSGTAVGAVSNDWLSLIVTIGVLAIILTLVIRSFAVSKSR